MSQASPLRSLGRRRFGSIHPRAYKMTADSATQSAPLPSRVILPLSQHIGAPACPIVAPGDKVCTGQLIAEASGNISASIHASLSGEVAPLITLLSPITGQPTPAIVIDSDGQDRWEPLLAASPETLSNAQITERIRRAGIVGLGGATFPTHLKVDRPPGSIIHTLLLNGAECEPYITADDRLMIESPERVVAGERLLSSLLSVERTLICIEKNKPHAIAAIQASVQTLGQQHSIEVVALPTRYPMGAEKTLIEHLLSIEIPCGKFPTDVGVVVQNVATAAAVSDAVVEGMPLVQRIVTVTGEVGRAKNLLVRIGTSADHLIEHCGGLSDHANQLIFGGPMMGVAQSSLNAPVMKNTNCILARRAERRVERHCIRCARCVERCPMGLMPQRFVGLVQHRRYDELERSSIHNCVECGACAHACPASIPIVSYIKTGKLKLRQLAQEVS